MNFHKEKNIFKKLNRKSFFPSHVAEVGVYHPETSNIYDYIAKGIKTTLVEPDPNSIARIKDCFSKLDNITLHEVAVFDRSGKLKLVQREASTFVSELGSSPAMVNDEYEINANDTFEVECRKFDEIDDGSIQLLSIDVEGSEWYVVQNLVSRPAVISIETHGAMYINPNIENITNWMQENDYIVWYKDRSDTVFVRQGAFQITNIDKIKLFLYDWYLFLRRYRKLIKKKIKAYFK